jgi:ribosomal protein L20
MYCFRNQSNMPTEVLKKKAKTKWNVDVHHSSLYRDRKKHKRSFMESWVSNTIFFRTIVQQLEAQMLEVVSF